MIEKLETLIAMQTEAGREGLAIWHGTVDRMSGAQRVEKSFELTEMTRRIMRDGIRAQHPQATEDQVQQIYLDRLLSYQGFSRSELQSLRSNGD